MDRFEKLNAIVRWTIAREGLTERNIYLFFSLREEKMQTNLAGTVTLVTSKVYTNNKKDTHHLVCVFFGGSGQDLKTLNATCRWHVAATSSKTGGYSYLFFSLREEKMQTNLAGRIPNGDI